jgi:hypothetical protein
VESYLPGERHAFRFQTLRFCSRARARGIIIVRSEVLRLRWLVVLRLANFGAPMQNGFCDWQNGVMRRLKIQAGHEVRAVRRPLPEPGDLTRATSQASHPAVFFVVVCATARESFPVLHPGEPSPRPADGFAVPCLDFDGQQHVRCSKILHTCIMLLVRAAMHPEADVDFVFLVDVSCSSTAKQHVTSGESSRLACHPKLTKALRDAR